MAFLTRAAQSASSVRRCTRLEQPPAEAVGRYGNPVRTAWLPWREAWHAALYGSDGFYRTASPAEHFRTSVHTSAVFASAIVALARRLGVHAVVDLGAGSGELLRHLAVLAPDLRLTGVDLRARPDDLAGDIGWEPEPPESLDGLLVANEVLDNVPCDVVELDGDGVPRLVEVRADTGEERLGDPASVDACAWLDAWWPLREPGHRAEVGLQRDRFWYRACAAVRSGACLAVDYGHLLDYRPAYPERRSYLRGREVEVALDGSRDVTAHVAVDSVAASVGASLARQRDMLHDLGVSGALPDPAVAATDPAAYVRALSTASGAAELLRSPGFGDFFWLLAVHDNGA